MSSDEGNDRNTHPVLSYQGESEVPWPYSRFVEEGQQAAASCPPGPLSLVRLDLSGCSCPLGQLRSEGSGWAGPGQGDSQHTGENGARVCWSGFALVHTQI